jgi:hypothetical protein
MKQIIGLTLILGLMLLMTAAALASPIMPTTTNYAFYVTGSTFNGGDIDGYELSDNDGLGMGAIIPITPIFNAGIRFGSDDYSDHNFAIQASLLPQEDGYLYRADFNRLSSEGSIGHLGVYRNFEGSQLISLCGGGGLSFISMHDAPKNTYISMYVELQAQARFDEAFFGYTGITYDYHLGATTLEIGFGMTI